MESVTLTAVQWAHIQMAEFVGFLALVVALFAAVWSELPPDDKNKRKRK